ncbi:unnamed protein product, partial [Vitis vinifera]|uniref:Uncharacterized protein n=1 Tax=Vitis vinifera TaxID=29760 RepID=D7TSL1_VITVI
MWIQNSNIPRNTSGGKLQHTTAPYHGPTGCMA